MMQSTGHLQSFFFVNLKKNPVNLLIKNSGLSTKISESGPNKHFISWIYRGSYMSAHVLLNLLKEFWKRDKM